MAKSFEVTENHLKLLSHMWVGWDDCEFGAPAIDPKRPYGNSDVVGDICEILGWIDGNYDGDHDEFYDAAVKLHTEMQTVLQILIVNRGIEVGRYETNSDYGIDYKKA